MKKKTFSGGNICSAFAEVKGQDDVATPRFPHLAVLEGDDDFLAASGPEEGTPAIAGPDLGHPNPAGARQVILPVAVPGELHLDATILVRGHLFLAGDGRRLHAGNMWPGRLQRRTKREIRGDARERILVRECVHLSGAIAGRLGVMDDTHDQVTSGIAAVLHADLRARHELHAVAGALNTQAAHGFLFHADPRRLRPGREDLGQTIGLRSTVGFDAVKAFGVTARIVEEFHVAHGREIEDMARRPHGHAFRAWRFWKPWSWRISSKLWSQATKFVGRSSCERSHECRRTASTEF